MGLLVKTLLIWLLVMALPAQGIAAATMAFCGPAHHSSESARSELVSNPSEHSHHGAAVVAHAHEVNAGTFASAPGVDGGSALVEAGQATQPTCSVCASCCSTGALPATAPAVRVIDSAPAVFATVESTVAAVAADGPERPPRNVLV